MAIIEPPVTNEDRMPRLRYFYGMRSIPIIAQLKKHKYKILFGALAFWVTIGLMIYVTEVIAHRYLGRAFIDEVEKKQYLLRWVLWLLLTPLILFLGLKINVSNTKIPWFILLHLLLGTMVLAIEFLFELAIIRPMAENIYHRYVHVGELILPFVLKYFSYVIMYFLIVGIVNIYVYMYQLQETQKTLMAAELQNKELHYRVTLSQLQMLKMQIHPHFLFNTHNAILGLILKNENEKAARMLDGLSSLLRLTLEKQDSEFVRLSEELYNVDLYLDIQSVRFGDRFSWSKNVSEAASQCFVPFFILQPLVENAVVHSIEKLDTPARILISAEVRNQQLDIRIVNDCPEDALAERFAPGIGLSNITRRLEQHYGNAAKFTLEKTAPGKITASLLLPAHEQAEDSRHRG